MASRSKKLKVDPAATAWAAICLVYKGSDDNKDSRQAYVDELFNHIAGKVLQDEIARYVNQGFVEWIFNLLTSGAKWCEVVPDEQEILGEFVVKWAAHFQSFPLWQAKTRRT
jgi:hypothetical protein